MQRQIQTWMFISGSLERNFPCMLLYVLESKGSSPGRQGFFMAVNIAGEMKGSIGGGIMEHKFVELAKEQLSVQVIQPDVKRQVHDKSAGVNQSGMICSGEQTVLLFPLRKKDHDSIQQIIHSLQENKNGTLRLSPSGLSFSPAAPAQDFKFSMHSEKDWEYMEKTGYKNLLIIIGGGHCALAFSKLMRDLGFYITLFEEREGLNTVVENIYAHEVIIVDDYAALNNLVSSGADQWVVIMTFGYRTDDVAIRALLDKKFRYFGVLGSKAKIEKMFAGYRSEGFSETQLQRIHAPIGLDIKSQTPEEIAVSIAAEIIREKNKL